MKKKKKKKKKTRKRREGDELCLHTFLIKALEGGEWLGLLTKKFALSRKLGGKQMWSGPYGKLNSFQETGIEPQPLVQTVRYSKQGTLFSVNR
jgi:hypothetical protein